MVSDRKLANAVAGKSARACDNCVRKRARLYCAADDAFLCQSCDSSVHSANSLARRHQRVRLKPTSSINHDPSTLQQKRVKDELQVSVPSWHQGFTRKPRTPRGKKHDSFFETVIEPLHDLVPEICGEEQENEEQLLYQVPVFDPFEVAVKDDDAENYNSHFGILPSELELADFAADVESLLGKGLEDEPFDMEGLGILDCDQDSKDCCLKMIKFEENYQVDYNSQITCEEDENRVDDFSKRLLKLDYEGVMSAWDDRKSPWTTGERPELDSGDWRPECLGTSGAMHGFGETSGGRATAMGDGEREARVSRYRQKRRTRLFSKKIRYEVRKLNAEKRPRMKGRFVKRPNFAASAFPLLNK